jgi:hypothetical protein
MLTIITLLFCRFYVLIGVRSLKYKLFRLLLTFYNCLIMREESYNFLKTMQEKNNQLPV